MGVREAAFILGLLVARLGKGDALEGPFGSWGTSSTSAHGCVFPFAQAPNCGCSLTTTGISSSKDTLVVLRGTVSIVGMADPCWVESQEGRLDRADRS